MMLSSEKSTYSYPVHHQIAEVLCWNYMTIILSCLCIAGMFAIRAERDYIVEEDMMKAVRKVAENKKLESKLDYKPVS